MFPSDTRTAALRGGARRPVSPEECRGAASAHHPSAFTAASRTSAFRSRSRRCSTARAAIAGLYLDDRIADYILDLVHATREPKKYGAADLVPLIEYGASPRATLALAACARAHAYLRGRGYVVPEDVKAIAPDVLRHRILTSYEAEAEEVTPDDIVRRVLKAVRVP